jgi:hypothetical protein
MERKVKCKTSYGKSEEKGEFGSPKNESLYLKGDTSITLRPHKRLIKKLLDRKPFFFFLT